MTWAVFQEESWRVRIAGMGVATGIEMDTARRKLQRAGLDDGIADDLLAACERGCVAAFNEKDGDVGNED